MEDMDTPPTSWKLKLLDGHSQEEFDALVRRNIEEKLEEYAASLASPHITATLDQVFVELRVFLAPYGFDLDTQEDLKKFFGAWMLSIHIALYGGTPMENAVTTLIYKKLEK